eukprot:scaffold243643_cov16-Tisochrysis_lutea.AAC.1
MGLYLRDCVPFAVCNHWLRCARGHWQCHRAVAAVLGADTTLGRGLAFCSGLIRDAADRTGQFCLNMVAEA